MDLDLPQLANFLAGLKADGVNTSGVAVDWSQPSGVAVIIVEEGGQNMIAVAGGANSTVTRRLADPGRGRRGKRMP